MLQRDYILRVIEDIVKFIAKLLKLVQEQDITKAYLQVVSKTEKLMSLKYQAFHQLSIDQLKELIDSKETSSEYLDALGQFFMVSGDICIEKNKRAEAQHFFQCADFCMRYADEQFKTFSMDRQANQKKVQAILTQMGAIH